jgi:PPOX class probable F420-dependent enzyme
MTMDDARLDRFLSEGAKLAVVSTVDRRGHPRSAPVWYEWREGAVLIFTGRSSLKWRNLERTPYASVCIDERESPYAGVVIDGPVEEVSEDDDPLYDIALRMAVRYYGDDEGRTFAEQYRSGSPGTVVFRVRPEHIVSWDYAADV